MKVLDTSVVVVIDRSGVDSTVAKLDDEGRHAISVPTLTELRLGLTFSHPFRVGFGRARWEHA